MRRPPSPNQILKFPVAGGTVLMAIVISLAWWSGKFNAEALMPNGEVRRGELWRLLTSIFLHVNTWHLVFDVYWTWVFGSLVEETFGHLITLLIFLLLAVGSSAAEFAFASGGVGLSGVGYGLFGMLWVLTYRDRRFAETIDKQTAWTFIGWFFFCIILTKMGTPIGNVAHGVGCAMGALMGWTMSGSRAARITGTLTTVVFLTAVMLGATIYRPWVNFSNDGSDEAMLGYDALAVNHNQDALRWYTDAIHIEPKNANYWYNRGIAQLRLNYQMRAKADFHHAALLDPSDEDYSQSDRDIDPGSN